MTSRRNHRKPAKVPGAVGKRARQVSSGAPMTTLAEMAGGYEYRGDDVVPDAELAGTRARGVIHARQLGRFIAARRAALGV